MNNSINSNTKILHIAVDSEYTTTDFVSLQVSIRDGELIIAKAFFVNSNLLNEDLLDVYLEFCEKENIEFIPVEYKDNEIMILPFLESVLEKQ